MSGDTNQDPKNCIAMNIPTRCDKILCETNFKRSEIIYEMCAV